MRLFRLLLFGQLIILFGDIVHGDEHQKVYQIKLVTNITEAFNEKNSYDIDERNLADLFRMERLSELERQTICKEAVVKANEKIENEPFKYVAEEGDETSVTKAYVVQRQDAGPFAQPKIILAYKCSTQPDLYVQIHDRRQRGVAASLVTIIFRKGDVKSAIRCTAEAMLYVDKLVDEILPVSPTLAEEAGQELADNIYDTNNFSEEVRMAMCRRALDVVITFENRNMKFLKGVHTTDAKRLYYLVTDAQNPSASAREVTLAFRCPTIPAVYLEVREIAEDESFWVSVIVIKSQLPQKFRDLIYNYQLKTVLSISETSTPVQTQRLPFYHIFEMLFYPSTISEIDPNRFTDRQRTRMCEQAFTIVDQEESQYQYLESVNPGKCGFYRVNFELGKSKEVQAFKCPTNPPIFLSLGDQGIEQNVWIYVEESEPIDIFPKLNIVGFKMKIVANIEDVSMSTLPKVLQTEDVQQSAIDPDALSRPKRKQLCEKAREVVSGLKILYFSEIAIEMSRYYKLFETESAETQSVKYQILQAYKCPTVPEILLHITERDGDGNVLWIIMKESETLPNMNFTGYQVKTFKEIVPVDPNDIGGDASKIPVEKSAIRIEKLDEDRRMQMCRTAHKIVSKANMKFLKKTGTETKKYYLVSSVSEGKVNRTMVQAFKCPTEPPLYLYIKDDKEKFTIRIMIEENTPTQTVIVDELRYEVMATRSDITEVKSSALKKETLDNMKQSAIDTDTKLTEGERLQMCLTAIGHIRGTYIFNFVDGRKTGEKKYYAVNVDSRAQTSRSIALQPIFVEAFECPTKPAVFLHVDEDKVGFTVWIIYKTPPPLIIDELTFEVKILKNITELSPEELKKEPSESVERLVVDTDSLPERERRKLCLNAVRKALADMAVEFLKDANAGKKKFYAVDEYSGLKESPYVRAVVQAFQCPSKPPVYVHINNRESSDEYEAWVILEQPLPNLDSLSYRFKLISEISAVASTRLVSKRVDVVDTNEFPPEYRLRLCEKAVEKISKDYVDIIPNQDPSASRYYNYQSIESEKQSVGTSGEETALAFKCATRPQIYIEVKKTGQKYSVWVLVKDVDLKDEGEEICYVVQFVESIIPVALFKSRAAVASSSEVDTDRMRVTTRSSMCNEARQQGALSNMGVQSTVNNSVENRYSKNFYTLELASGERYNVEAFACPTEPPIYLQIRCWKYKCHIVSVIVEKKLSQQPVTKMKDLEELGDESTKSRKASDSDEDFIEYTITRNGRGKASRVRESATGSRRPKDMSVNSRKSRGSVGSINWDEPATDSETVDLQERGAFKSPRTKGTGLSRLSDEEIFQRAEADDSSPDTATNDDLPFPSNIKRIDSAELATENQISMMPSAPREKSQVNTDTAYTKEQRKRMCRWAIKYLQPVDDVKYLSKADVGPCRFYIVHERPLINRAGKQVLVRAFACPTEPQLYLEVRRTDESGTSTSAHKSVSPHTMTIIVKNKSFVTFDLKIANTIGKITTVTQTSEKKNERNSDDERLVNAKRYHMCRRAFQIIEKLVKGSNTLGTRESVGDEQSYILNLGDKDVERVRAFQCPSKADVYLQVQPQNGYTKVSIIMLASQLSSPLEYAECPDYVNSRQKIDAKKISYSKKLVSNITEDNSSPVVDEDERFVPDERDAICSEAIKLFPDEDFTFLSGFPEKSRNYVLNAQYHDRDTVRAFRCPTVPPVYVRVEVNEATGYAWASVIMQVKKKPPQRDISSSGPSSDHDLIIGNIRFRLVPVTNIDTASKGLSSLSADDIPPVPHVQYKLGQREEICENSLEALRTEKDFIKMKEKPKDGYVDHLFVVQYESESGIEKKLVSAFKCATDPQIYIEMGWDEESNMAVANVIIARQHLPAPSE